MYKVFLLMLFSVVIAGCVNDGHVVGSDGACFTCMNNPLTDEPANYDPNEFVFTRSGIFKRDSLKNISNPSHNLGTSNQSSQYRQYKQCLESRHEFSTDMAGFNEFRTITTRKNSKQIIQAINVLNPTNTQYGIDNKTVCYTFSNKWGMANLLIDSLKTKSRVRLVTVLGGGGYGRLAYVELANDIERVISKE